MLIKKTLKDCTAFFLCAAVLLSLCGTKAMVMADEAEAEEMTDISSEFSDAKTETAYIALRGFGIASGYEDGSVRPENEVTRTEFTVMVCNLLGLNITGPSSDDDTPFTDVSDAFWGRNYISGAYNYNVVSGYGDGRFGPEDSVTQVQSLKILLSAMGYANLAESKGGYPSGYLIVASDLKLTDNLKIDGNATASRGEIINMIYNAMQADMMQNRVVVPGAVGSVAVSGHTLLVNLENSMSLKLLKGNVMTVGSSSLVGKSSLRDNQISVSGITANMREALNPYAYLGREVIAFADITRQGEYILRDIYLTPGKNNTLMLSAEQIEGYEHERYKYVDESLSIKYVAVSASASVVYNGTGLDKVTQESFSVRNGAVLLVDADVNDEYDTVFIAEYQSYVVAQVDKAGEMLYFRADNVISASGMEIDSHSGSYQYYFVNRKGNSERLTDDDAFNLIQSASPWNDDNFDSINAGDVISVLRDEGRNVILLVLYGRTVCGTVNEMNYSDGKVQIDGGEYHLFRYPNSLFAVKQEDLHMEFATTFYVDAFETIVAVDTSRKVDAEAEGTARYGYAYVLKAESRGLGGVKVLLLHGSRIKKYSESVLYIPPLNPEDESESIKNRFIIEGQRTEALTCAPSLRVNGQRISDLQDVPVNAVVEYFKNEDGQITSIVSAEKGNLLERRYYKNHMVFTNHTLDGAFKADNDTLFYIIPSSAQSADDYTIHFTIEDGYSYDIEAHGTRYVFSNNIPVASGAVIYTDATAHAPGIITDSTPVTIVSKFTQALDENDMHVAKLYGHTDGVYESMLFLDGVSTTELQKGDLAKLSRNADGKIDGYTKIASLAELTNAQTWYRAGARGKNERVFGVVYDKEDEVLSPLYGEMVGRIRVVYSNDFSMMRTYDITEDLQKNFYIYDEKTSEVRLANINNVHAYTMSADNASRVFLYISMGAIKAIVILP